MTVALPRSPVPAHTGSYTRKRPSSLRHPLEIQRPQMSRPQLPRPKTNPCPNSNNKACLTSEDVKDPASLELPLQSCTKSKCVFCRIALGASPAEVLYRDNELMVIKDHHPVSEHHYLVMPIVHLLDVRHLKSSDLPLLRRMEVLGLRILQERGAVLNDLRMGFHLPPFSSISHLHLHCIAPASKMGYFHRNVTFRPDSLCFLSMDHLIVRLLSLQPSENSTQNPKK